MKKVDLFLLFLVCLLFFACSESGGGIQEPPGPEPEPEELLDYKQIEEDYNIICLSIDNVLNNPSMPENELTELLKEYDKLSSVTDVSYNESGIHFIFEDNLIFSCLYPVEPEDDFVDIVYSLHDNEEKREVHTKSFSGFNMPGNEDAAIINFFSEAQNNTLYKSTQSAAEEIENALSSIGYKPISIPSNKATLEFFKNELVKYGTICLFNHGGEHNTLKIYVMPTGELIGTDFEKVFETYNKDIRKRSMCFMRVSVDSFINESGEEEMIYANVYGITKYFFDDIEALFPNSFFIMVLVAFYRINIWQNLFIRKELEL